MALDSEQADKISRHQKAGKETVTIDNIESTLVFESKCDESNLYAWLSET